MNDSFQVNEKIGFSLDDQKTKLNNNFLVIGPPGCGKTSIMSYNNLKNKIHTNQVIVDVKGRMKDLKAKYLEMGYIVQIIDLIHPENSMGYNPLLYVESDQEIQYLANSLFGDITSKDPYWDMMAKELLFFAIYYVVHACPLEKRNLKTVFSLIHSIKTDSDGLNLEFLIDYYREFHPEDKIIFDLYQSCNVQAKTTISCILNSLNAKLTAYISDEIQSIFSKKKQINFDLLAKKKCVFFITMQDFDTTYHPIVNMVLSQATKRLYQLADEQPTGRLPYNVDFILDDFGSYTINNFPALISTGRSRGIWFTIMLQSISQLKKRYEVEYFTILECCDRILYMGGNGIDTINYLHELCNCRKSVLSLLPVGKVMFWQRGKEGIVTDTLDATKEPEYCYWNYNHMVYKKKKRKQESVNVLPDYKNQVLDKIKECIKTEQTLLLNREELFVIIKSDCYIESYEWLYPKHSNIHDDLMDIYRYFECLPKECMENNQFIFYSGKKTLKKLYKSIAGETINESSL